MLVQLQYVRAIAALLVVYFHSVLQLERVLPNADLTGVIFGESGVDLFFILSGFVMWLTTAERQIGPAEFYRHRIERIVPLYWLFTIMASGIALIMPAYLRSTQFDLMHLLASLFFIPWVNPANATDGMIAPVIIPGWTLNYEMYFYLIFGALLLIQKKMRLPALFAVLTVIFLAAYMAPEGSTVARFYGNSVIFEFLAGVLIARLYLAGKVMGTASAIVAAIVFMAILLWADYAELHMPRSIVAGIPAAIVIYSLVSIDFSRFPESRFLHRLGDASYSLYITHVFTLVGVRIAYLKSPFEWTKNEYLFLIACIAGSVIVALLVYRFYEKPAAGYLKSRRKKKASASRIASAQETA